MLRHQYILFAGLMSAVSIGNTRDVVIPKSVIIELIDYHCSSPDPNPKTNPVLEYDCSDAYEDADGEAQSMNYNLRLIPLLKQDFNQDGNEDLAVEIESMGPLGGSVYTNSAVHYLLLDKDRHIIKQHEILLYAPFSEHVVEYKLKGTRLYYSAIPNYRSHPEAYKDGELIDTALEFEINWTNGKPISTYYRDNCRLATIKNKPLLKLARGVTREIDIDIHEYTQVITEKAQISNLQITASLEGCNTTTAIYDVVPLQNQQLPVLAEVLSTLIPIVHHNQQLKALLTLDRRSQIKFSESIDLYPHWRAIVHVDRKSESSDMRIVIEQTE